MTTRSYRSMYNGQRYSSRQRGIEFNLSFEQWLTIWEASGHLTDRGTGPGKYVMARKFDRGSYEVNNVEIITCEENTRAAWSGDGRVKYKATWRTKIQKKYFKNPDPNHEL